MSLCRQPFLFGIHATLLGNSLLFNRPLLLLFGKEGLALVVDRLGMLEVRNVGQ